MKKMLMTLMVVVIAIPVAAQETEKKQSDKLDLSGKWTIKTGLRAGEKIDAERLQGEVQVTAKTFTMPAGPDDEFVMSYKIDNSKSPAQIDIDIESGPVPEGHAVGIVKRDGDKFVLCYDPEGQNRPEKFESTGENGCFMFELQRAGGKFDVDKLVGAWDYVSGERGGEKVDKERLVGTVVISKKKFTLPAGPDEKFVMIYEIDASKSPAIIDLEIESGPAPEGKALGIIKMDGDNFVFCYDPTGQNRPEKFETDEDNGFFMFTLKPGKEQD